MTKWMVVAPTFNASHQTSWLHLCGKDHWTVLPWPPWLRRGLGRYLMRQVLKWWPGRLTNGRVGSSKGSYIIWETLQGEGFEKICREYIVATRTKIVSKSKRTISKNRKVFLAKSLSFFAFLLFLIHYTYCLIHWNLVFNPLSTNSLYQVFWALVHSSFGVRIKNLSLHKYMEKQLP